MNWIRETFPQAKVRADSHGYLRISHPADPGAPLRAPSAAASCVQSRSVPLRGQQPRLFFDLETLGFLGHPVFLIGILRPCRQTRAWEVVQLLARDYTEEEAILNAFAREASRRRRWVSFNGKSFDLPFLRQRAAFYGVRLPEATEHVDLLHAARRVYRDVLPDCRLQTLEAQIFGQYRVRDLPGGEIPAAYHAYVRGEDPEAMSRILLHNRTDLLTLARLLAHLEGDAADEPPARLCRRARGPEEPR